MKFYELNNDLIHVALAEDASRLIVSSDRSGLVYSAADYAAFFYGGIYRYDLATHGRAHVKHENDELRIVFDRINYWIRFPENGFQKPDPGPELRFEFRIRLDGDEAVFITDSVEGMDDETVQVSFPYRPLRWNPAAPAELAFSGGTYGTLWSFPATAPGRFTSGHEPLPLCGLFDRRGGIGIRCCTPFDQLTEHVVSSSEGWTNTQFEFERQRACYPRETRIFFFAPGENYVHLAKFYRKKIEGEGRFVSLADKIAANPEVGKLPGSVIWKHNVFWGEKLPENVGRDYSLYVSTLEAGQREGKVGNWTAKEVFDTAHNAGFDRVCIFNTGWNHYGFDCGYPTRFPVNSERGTEADFLASASYGRSLSPDYILSVHDNYRDAYRKSPEFNLEEMIQNAGKQPVKGGIWRGGRCFLMCGANGLRYAKRDLPRIAGLSGRGCIYLDVLGCVDFLRCHHSAHPGSGREDAGYRLAILQEAKHYFGAVATEGAPHDFCASVADLGAYCAIRNPYLSTLNTRSIPLWQLVYHDSVLNYAGEGISGVSGSFFRNYQALYCLLPAGFDKENLRISKELRVTCCAEMVLHEFLQDEIQRTVFSDGTVVTADFSSKNGERGNFELQKEC